MKLVGADVENETHRSRSSVHFVREALGDARRE
jgi:hypothetical protein